MIDDNSSSIRELERQIDILTEQLEKAKNAIQQWTDASASLSQSAAEARAKNQGKGRGFLGGLLGSKYRGAMRGAAAASNAAISQDVAAKRAKIAEGKRQAQDVAQNIKARLDEAKKELKRLTSNSKSRTKEAASATKAAATSIDLLKKLKEAHTEGLLTDEEYESKRKKLISQI